MAKLVLDGGIALVTGAAAGIGKETVFSFAEAGVEGIVLADLDKSGADDAAVESKKLARNAKFRTIVVQADISDEAAVNGIVDAAIKEFGRIDYCVHCAGMGNISGATTENIKVDIFDKTMAVNVRGTMLVVHAVSKAMAGQEPRTYHSVRHGLTRSLGRGSIVTAASVNAFVPAPGMLPYTSSKHAVIGITKTAALDNIKNQIRVNAVCPTWTNTPMLQASLKRVPILEQSIQKFSPLGRAATTEEVVDYIMFLSSPSASYINGTCLMLDAGLTLAAHGAANI
ncbi:oxidoreductase [Talaromyces proteolyticus]|uniref:Oxidoreductase n=1 Tax=Talaromyces proteolyticus TaxID=1131652 RepID=A0AAD4KV16_9EURO|nr:oxidoreductase [Talaromyces proteolyticus]KAH8697356.1 oxidoreductase [Talaromyces proteolyticus]